MRRFPILLSLLLSLPLQAATVHLGNETAVGVPTLASAPEMQTILSVATNGQDYLALWTDNRQNLPVDTSRPPGLYIGRVDAAGHPFNPRGHRLMDAATGQLVYTGSSYLLLFGPPEGNTYLQAVDSDGNLAGLKMAVPSVGTPISAISNGRTIAVLHHLAGNLTLSLVNFDGTSTNLTTLLPYLQPPQLFVMPNGDYGLVTSHYVCPGNVLCTVDVQLDTMNGTTGSITERSILTLPQIPSVAANVDSAGRILVGWILETQAGRTASYEVIGPSGNVIVPPVEIASEPLRSISGYYRPAVGWDGHEFLLTLNWPSPDETTSELLAYRVNTAGQLLDTTPIDVGTRPVDPPLFASGTAGQLIAWDAAPQFAADVFGRGTHTFDDLAAAPTNVLASATVRQQTPRLAPAWMPYAIWHEGNETESVTGSIIGANPAVVAHAVPPPVNPPAVARGREAFLVAWSESIDQHLQVFARRVAFDGTPIDATPISVAQIDQYAYDQTDALAVGSDGTNFLVAWAANDSTGYNRLEGTRISAAGAILDAQPIVIEHVSDLGAPAMTRIAWTGSRYLVAWLHLLVINTLVSPPPPPVSTIRVASVSSSGEVLDNGETPQIGAKSVGEIGELALAASPNGALLLDTAPSTQFCLQSVPLGMDGRPTADIRQIACGSGFPPRFTNLDLAWDGTEYAGVWADSATSSVNALRFDIGGHPLDDAPFAVSPAGKKSVQPAIAASAGGATIGYIRLSDDPRDEGVARLFVRTLERVGGVGRVRAVR